MRHRIWTTEGLVDVDRSEICGLLWQTSVRVPALAALAGGLQLHSSPLSHLLLHTDYPDPMILASAYAVSAKILDQLSCPERLYGTFLRDRRLGDLQWSKFGAASAFH